MKTGIFPIQLYLKTNKLRTVYPTTHGENGKGKDMPAIGRMEVIFLRAIREVLPQYRAATDEFLQSKLERRIYPATEEIVCLLESSGASLKNDAVCAAMMTKVLQILSDYMTHEMKITVTIKTLLDCLSLMATALDRRYPHAIKWGTLPWELIPNYSNNPQQYAAASR